MKWIEEVGREFRFDDMDSTLSCLMVTTMPLEDNVQPVDAGHIDDLQRSRLPLLPKKVPRVVVDLELVNQLRDEEC